MDGASGEGKRSRRQFLAYTFKVGLGAFALASLGVPTAQAAPAGQALPAPRGRVLVADSVEAASEFARGQARGAAVAAEAGKAALRGSAGAEFISGDVALPFVATHLGLHWVLRADAPEALAVAVRTRAERGQWSEWYPLTIEALAERPEGSEVFAALAPGAGGASAQYRLTFLGGEAWVDSVTVTTINVAGGAPQPEAASALATVTVASPVPGLSLQVVPRETWGCTVEAEEKLPAARDALWPEMYVPAKKVVIHHTATSNSYTNGAAEVLAIWTYHAVTLGWGDIGYNVLIDHDGVVYEGRHGRGEDPASRQILTTDVVAGHDLYYNYGTAGLSCVGDFSSVSRRPRGVLPYQYILDSWPNLLPALEEATAFTCARHYIEPGGASDFLRSDDTWSSAAWGEPMANISGHRETNATACPGAGLFAYLPTLVANVSARLAVPGMNAAVPALSCSLSGQTATFNWSSSAYSLYHAALEGWQKEPGSGEKITYLTDSYQDSYVDPDEDPYAKDFVWQSGLGTSLTYTFPAPGHYTMHVRGEGGLYEANVTLLVGETATKPVHLGDLDGSVKALNKNSWNATVVATVHDEAHNGVSGVTVTGTWSGAYNGSATATTGSNGTCSLTTPNIRSSGGTVKFEVTNLGGGGFSYDSSVKEVGTSIELTK